MTIRTILTAALLCAPTFLAAQVSDTLVPRGLCVGEVDALRRGYDMGGARTAEAVGLPSPERAIELADELTLNLGQIEAINAVHNVVLVEGQRLGRAIIEHESKLDSIFTGDPRDWTVRPIVLEIGNLQTELRYVHLRARMRMKDILSTTQQKRYATMVTEKKTEHAGRVGE
ncbi:MAG: hypothetical protein H7X80_01040 [bacterium]|nr:hypothetical protein [Candidatus Kapabacteria bacterium]